MVYSSSENDSEEKTYVLENDTYIYILSFNTKSLKYKNVINSIKIEN